MSMLYRIVGAQVRTLQRITPTPEQLRILTDAQPGFRLIRGAAGSGKTTAALLRLRQLCNSRRNRRARLGSIDPVRVLVLTFNRTLRGYISELAAEQVDILDDIVLDVETFGYWARSLLEEPNILKDDGRQWICSLLREAGVPFENQEYFYDEVKYVQGRFPLGHRDRYLNATRSGRGRAPAVPRELRHKILDQVIAPYEIMKAEKGTVDWNDVALKAARVPCQGYDIVVVDETQDLSANQIRTILAHLNEDHVTTFIIDTAQRIYAQGFQWGELGIDMRRQGMAFRLARNHRNTAEIARLASSLVSDLPPDADGVVPDEESCQMSDIRPRVVVGKYSAQIDYMLDQVQPFLHTSETIAILQPWGGGWFDCLRNTLGKRNIRYCELTRNPEWPTGPELVALSMIHSAKGLEFDHVLLPGLSNEVTPHGNEDGDGTLESLRRLVAMGVGRARKTVMLGYKPGERSSVFDYIDSETYDLVKV